MTRFRTEQIGDCRLYLGDAAEMIDVVGPVDAVLTDPPYGISYCHGARRGGRLSGTDGMAIVGDDQPFDPTPWLAFNECLFWGAEHFKHALPPGGRWLVWNKRRPGVVRDQGCVENAWHSISGVTRIINHVWDGADRQGERDEARVHSNQKPVGVMQWCLGFVSGHRILDPYMGSGTTGVACVNLERPFVGVEIDPEHFDTACRRIEAAYKQPRLFEEPRPKAVQPSLLGLGDGEGCGSPRPTQAAHDAPGITS